MMLCMRVGAGMRTKLLRRLLSTSSVPRSDVWRVDNPYTGSTVCEVPLHSSSEVSRVLETARQRQQTWAHSTLSDRRALVEAFADYLLAHDRAIAIDISLQMGKPLTQALAEVKTAVQRIRALSALANRYFTADEMVPTAPNLYQKIVREPIGTALILSPWNYPLLTTVNGLIAAVLAGNTVILKHSDRTPLAGKVFADGFAAAGADAGLMQNVAINHDDVARLIRHPTIAHVTFTGSVDGGRAVYENVGKHTFIDAQLELGGKDAAYVRADADVQYAVANIVDGALYNAGQSCCAVERVLVHRDIFEDFIARAHDIVRREYVLGDPLEPTTTLGPIAQPHQPKRIQAAVDSAVADGAQIVIGGRTTTAPSGLGRFFAPTILRGVTADMCVMKEETFGPVIPVIAVDSDDAALQLINDSPFGLTASLWTRDVLAAESLAARADVGTVFLNRSDYVDPFLVWSGRRHSGKGAALGPAAFNAFTRTKSYNFRTVTA